MIVQCDKCETKFRIADGKVTGGGVKVRCSKCAHVFVVRKEAGLETPAGTPSLSFGEVGATTVKVSPDKLATIAAGSTPPSRPPRSIPPPATTQEVAAALGFGSAPPRAPQPEPPRSSGLPAFPESTRRELPTFPDPPTQDRFPEPRALSEMKTEQMRLPGSKRDPFHDFAPPALHGADPFPKQPSSPGHFPPGIGPDPFAKIPSQSTEPFPKLHSDGNNPFVKLHPDGNGPFAKISSSAPDPFAKIPSSSSDPFSKIPSSSPMNAFDRAPASHDPFAKIPSGSKDPFAKIPSGSKDPFPELGSQPGANPFIAPDPFSAISPVDPYPAPQGHRAGPDPFPDANPLSQPLGRPESNPFQNPPAPGPDLHQRGVPKSDPKTGMFPPPPDLGKPRSNVEKIVPAGATDDDPFADIDIGVPPPMFDAPVEDDFMSPPSPPRPTPEPLARIRFGSTAQMHGEVSHAKTAVAAAYRDEETESSIGVWPTVVGAAVGLVIALFVFPGLVGGWTDLRMGTELIQPKKLLPESLERVSPLGARVTSYDGRNGARMLVVSGSARNETETTLDNVQAVVLMMDGDEIVERRRALVGVALDEATLASVESPADLEAAYRTAKQNASPEQLEIDPGANARFVVVFPEIPDGIEQRKFRVEFVKAPQESAKKTEPTP